MGGIWTRPCIIWTSLQSVRRCSNFRHWRSSNMRGIVIIFQYTTALYVNRYWFGHTVTMGTLVDLDQDGLVVYVTLPAQTAARSIDGYADAARPMPRRTLRSQVNVRSRRPPGSRAAVDCQRAEVRLKVDDYDDGDEGPHRRLLGGRLSSLCRRQRHAPVSAVAILRHQSRRLPGREAVTAATHAGPDVRTTGVLQQHLPGREQPVPCSGAYSRVTPTVGVGGALCQRISSGAVRRAKR